jgi:signal transduction histidine kinase
MGRKSSPKVSNELREFIRSILKPLTLSDLLSELPDAFQTLLPPRAWCEVLVDSDDLAPESARLCIPIHHDGDALGTVVVYWNDDVQISPDREQLLRDAVDVAGHVIANRQATDAQRERARADAADVRFDLIGMLAHEMRTPLASIKGYASAMLLEDIDLDNEMTIEFLQAIDEESDRLNELVTHLLDSTVIEAGALELQREPVLLPGLIRRVADIMSRRTERHRIVVSTPPDVRTVYADEQRLQQILTNLIDNAIKYSPDGGMIMVRCHRSGNEAVVAVSDQGIGIAPEHLNKLFERFFRTEQRRTHGVSGTGLGLPIVDAIVRAHGGRIWAESVVDEGTTLTFTLPIYRNGDDEQDNDE